MEPEYQDVISSFYEAALDSRHWSIGMRKLAQFADAQAALAMRANLGDPGATVLENVGNPPEAMREYAAFYSTLDPMYGAAPFTRPGTWLSDWKLVGPGLARTEWYNDFCRRFDTHAILSNLVYSQGGRMASVSIQRALGQPVFSEEDERRLEPIVPHLQRAARLFFGVEELRAKESLARAVLDTLHLAVWVLEGDGTVLLANAPAERAAQRTGGILRLRFGRLESSAGDGRWDKALRAATHATRPQGACLVLRGAVSRDPLLVVPCTAASHWGSAFQRPVAVAVLAQSPAHAPRLEQTLGVLYGLTAAEARIAGAIANGLAPADIAQRLQTSVQTTRTQLKAVFSKTGVRRQAELTKLLADLRMIGVQ